jgi:hypothetical protein
MKKVLVLLALVSLLVSASSAQLLIGGRAAGMGGTGVAASKGLDAAYYNPACLMRSSVAVTQVEIGLGAGYTDVAKLSSAISSANDPGKFVLDNFANNLSFNGDLTGIVGVNVKKIGISVLPMMAANVNKPANSLGGSVSAGGFYNGVMTLGYTFSVPFLPAALDVGANLKAINAVMGSANLTAGIPPTTATGTQNYSTGTGFGLDLGVLTSFNVPMISQLAVGLVLRDISSSVTLKTTQDNLTLNQTTGTVTKTPGAAIPDQTLTIDGTTAIGAYTTIPVVGLGVAMDLEMTKNSGTNTHIGLEYPLLMNTIILRAGMASGQNLGLTTYGAEVDLRIAKVALVGASDSKNTGLTRSYIDIGFGL